MVSLILALIVACDAISEDARAYFYNYGGYTSAVALKNYKNDGTLQFVNKKGICEINGAPTFSLSTCRSFTNEAGALMYMSEEDRFYLAAMYNPAIYVTYGSLGSSSTTTMDTGVMTMAMHPINPINTFVTFEISGVTTAVGLWISRVNRGRVRLGDEVGIVPRGFLPVEDATYIYAGTQSGHVVRVTKDVSSGFQAEAFPVGCCEHRSYLMGGDNPTSFVVGTETGIVFKVEMATMTAIAYSYVGSNLYVGVLDTSVEPPVPFFVSEGYIHRLNWETLAVEASESTVSAMKTLAVIPGYNYLFSMRSSSGPDYTAIRYNMVACDAYADCQTCAADVYCGWCGSVCQGSTTECAVTMFSAARACPAFVRVSPSSGPAEGTNVVTVVGTNFLAGTYSLFLGDALPEPYTESFEVDRGQWTHEGGTYEWSRGCGCTPTSSTGPCSGAEGSCYMYTEASSNSDRTFGLLSPVSPTYYTFLSFSYHIYGGSRYNFLAQRFDGSEWYTLLQSNHDENRWYTFEEGLPEGTEQIRFRVTTDDYRSDLAVDSVTLTSFHELLPATREDSSVLTFAAPQYLDGRTDGSTPFWVLKDNELYFPESHSYSYRNCYAGAGNCGTCSAIDPLCDYCANDQTCKGKGFCAGDVAINPCPTLDRVTPDRSATSTSVVTVSASFFPTSADSYSCNFGGTVVPATRASSTTLTCFPPNVPSSVVDLSIEFPTGTDFFETTLPFTFFSCGDPSSSLNCGSCVDGTETCGFCYQTGQCLTSSGACASGFYYSLACPTISVLPTRGPVNEATSLTISASEALLPTAVYRCVFVDIGSTMLATTGAGNTLTCDSPLVPTVNSTAVRVEFSTGGAYSTFATSSADALAFYDCTAFTSCGDCLEGALPQCGWCLSSAACVASTNCLADHLDGSGDGCPTLDAPTPGEGASEGGTTVVLQSSYFTDSLAYECVWDTESSQQTSAATRISASQVNCLSLPASGEETSVGLLYGGVRYADDVYPFTYFDCGSAATCTECLGAASNILCGWCVASAVCGGCSMSDVRNKGEQCPIIFYSALSPRSGSLDGGSVILINGPEFSAGVEYTCVASGGSRPATFEDATTLSCVMPSSEDTVASISVLAGGQPYASNSLSFTYYDCGEAIGCLECVANTLYSECGWCEETQTCSTRSSCPVASPHSNTCPVMTSINKDSGASTGGTEIIVSADHFVDLPGYTCVFDHEQTTAASRVSNTELKCITPVHARGPTIVTVNMNAIRYADDSVIFIYYNCSQTTACEACTNSPYFEECGWCVDELVCGTSMECASTFSADACPVVTNILPAAGSEEGGTEVTITGTMFFLPSGAAASLSCQFGNSSVPAVVVADDTVTCVSPPQTAGDVFLTVLGPGGKRHVSDTRTFSYYSCNGGPACSDCVDATKPECGFCESSATCASSVSCAVRTSCLEEALVVAAAPEDDGPSSASLAAGLIVLCCFLTIIGVLAAIAFKKREAAGPVDYNAPILNKKAMEELKFGARSDQLSSVSSVSSRTSMKGGSAIQGAVEIQERLFAGGLNLKYIHALCQVAPSKQQDSIANALVIVTEATNGRTAEVMCSLATQEIAKSTSQATLFRLNSYTTKMWKSLTRIHGMEYIRETLAWTINEALATAANTEVDDNKMADDSDTEVNKWTLLITCKKLLRVIFQSENVVPLAFRQVLSHVAQRVNEKFQMEAKDMGVNIQVECQAQLEQLKGMYQASGDDFSVLSIESEGGMGATKEAVKEFDDAVETMRTELGQLMETFNDIEAASDPNSAAAALVLKKHQDKLSSISVGGFFFLRFVLAAVTAPDMWGIIRYPPVADEGRRMLTLVSKVLMNLSNGREFGKKEGYMLKMNEFITSNLPSVHEFFHKLAEPVDFQPVKDESIPNTVVNESLEVLAALHQEHEEEIRNALERMTEEDVDFVGRY